MLGVVRNPGLLLERMVLTVTHLATGGVRCIATIRCSQSLK